MKPTAPATTAVTIPPDCLLGPAVRALLPTHWEPANPPAGWDCEPGLAASMVACREATRQHARTFHFASFALPRSLRRASYALYAFCRHIDDAIDRAPAGDAVPTREALLAELDALLTGRSPLPFCPAFAAMARAYGMPREFLADLIEGCARDREPARMESFAELEVYCHYVAAVVGLMMAKLFGLADPAGVPRAVEMGIAMQLTNILRDVREDAGLGRIYLPADELAAAGITTGDLLHGRHDTRWREFMAGQVGRARRYYAAGSLGLTLLAKGAPQRTATLMAAVYGGILTEIERQDYDVFTRRARVTFPRKLAIATRTLAKRPR